jgi:hypothetical protein
VANQIHNPTHIPVQGTRPYKLANHGIAARSQGSDSQARGIQGAVALCRWEQLMRAHRPLQSDPCLQEPNEDCATTSTRHPCSMGQTTSVATDRDGLHSVPCHPGVLCDGKSCLRFSEYLALCLAFCRAQFSKLICASVLRRFEVMGGHVRYARALRLSFISGLGIPHLGRDVGLFYVDSCVEKDA